MGTLVVIGTGIHIGQLTCEAKEWLMQAEKVLYCVSDAASERAILNINSDAESLYRFYGEGKPRSETYSEMVSRTLECLDEVEILVVAYYGHPGFFVAPSHRAIRLARERGHEAFMLPAVSSFDCLIADLGVSIAGGCQIYEATDLMIRQRRIDVGASLVIMQVSSLGDVKYSFNGFDHRHLGSLREYLLSYYPTDFEITAYYASQFSVAAPRVEKIAVTDLTIETVKSVATLYVPALTPAPIHLKRLQEYELDEPLLKGKRLVPLNARFEDEKL